MIRLDGTRSARSFQTNVEIIDRELTVM